MSGEDVSSLQSLLGNTEVQEITGNLNPELIERKTSVASKCDVFTRPYTALSQDPQYTFVIHPEAQKQLPDIINNKVEKVVGLESPDESFKERYHRCSPLNSFLFERSGLTSLFQRNYGTLTL